MTQERRHAHHRDRFLALRLHCSRAMTTRDGIRRVCASVFVLALGVTAGCAAIEEGPDIGSEQTTLGITDIAAPLPPTQIVDGRTVNQTNYLDEFGQVNVCECTSSVCFDDWVLTNFGCNVCVGFACDNFNGHTCNTCEEPSTGSTELVFHGDETRAL
jgi:hypothetical protein